MKEKCEEIIFACMEHVEQAIDDYVNFQEVSPQLIKIKEEQKCTYCSKNAEYIIMK
jgi:CxxH/CxxC protein (TIGR04129 family)